GARLDAETGDGRTPLAVAVGRGAPVLVRLLIERGATAEGEAGGRALAAAAASGSLEIVQMIAEAGAALDGADAKGRTALAIAAAGGLDEMAVYLLAKGAKPNALNPVDGTTALMWAANAGFMDIVKALLAAGADVGVVAKDGWDAVKAAEMAGHDDIARLLRRGA
ncbi:MAG: ankyrin repeat domain-containing protein, partial [Hyphomicrobiales bacterium]|nr:ankyrin repeat domain-containing protein [Hyphomicrobiales bacterium]